MNNTDRHVLAFVRRIEAGWNCKVIWDRQGPIYSFGTTMPVEDAKRFHFSVPDGWMVLGQSMTKNRIHPDRNNIVVAAAYIGVVPKPPPEPNQHTIDTETKATSGI